MEIGQAPQQGRNSELAFQAGQRSTNTEMKTFAKCKMSILLAQDIQYIWICERIRVTIGRGQHECNLISTLNQFPSQFDILKSPTVCGPLKRPLIPQTFLKSHFDQ